LACRIKSIALPYDTLPTREQWTARAQSTNHWIAYHAQRNVNRLNHGEKLPDELPYLVQTWNFGRELAMVFLPGEVVVDYSLRLKHEYDARRLWINAYANDVPCYIPSKRIWREGGYEGGDAMIYYDRPTRLSEGTEELIVAAVHKLLPRAFEAAK
jgi:neutral ceramidase